MYPDSVYGVAYGASTTTITLPSGAFWVVALLCLGGMYWYITGVRDWISEMVSKVRSRA